MIHIFHFRTVTAKSVQENLLFLEMKVFKLLLNNLRAAIKNCNYEWMVKWWRSRRKKFGKEKENLKKLKEKEGTENFRDKTYDDASSYVLHSKRERDKVCVCDRESKREWWRECVCLCERERMRKRLRERERRVCVCFRN